MTDAQLARHWFEITETGDDALPWAVWDTEDECPLDFFETRLEAEAAIVRLGWSVGRKLAGLDPMWPR